MRLPLLLRAAPLARRAHDEPTGLAVAVFPRQHVGAAAVAARHFGRRLIVGVSVLLLGVGFRHTHSLYEANWWATAARAGMIER